MPLLNHSSAVHATIVSQQSAMLSTMVDYRDRLQLAMAEHSVTAKDLAEHCGLTYQAVKKVLDGKSNAFNAVNHALAARYLDVRSDWLALGDGPMRPRDYEPVKTWPFPSVDERKVRGLNHEDIVRLDAVVLYAASQVGLDLRPDKDDSAVA